MTFLRAAHVVETLSGWATSVEQHGPAHWTFSPNGAADLGVETRVEGDWLALTLRLPERPYEPSPETLWAVLEENGKLPGGVKLARLPGEKELSACAEIRLDDEIDLKTRIPEVCAGFQVCAGLRAEGAVGPQVPGNGGMGVISPSSDLRDLLGEAGWTCKEQPTGGLVVDLDVGDGLHQAVVEEKANPQVAITTELARLEEGGSVHCRHALGLLLFRACTVVRMARAAAAVTENHARARFEVVFDTGPSAAELAHALGALAAARGLCAREARLLASDEGIARHYLALWSSEPPGGG